jgi:signal transduction histidine kinase
MKLQSILYFFYFIFFLFANISVGGQNTRDNGTRIKNLLAQCDSIKSNFMIAAKDDGALLRKLAFEGLQFTLKNDVNSNARFHYYIASGFIFQQPANVDSITYYFLKSLNEAKQSKSAQLILMSATSMMHIGFEMQNAAQTEAYKNVVQSIVDTTKDQTALQDGYAALATYYQQKAYYNTAQTFLLKSIELQQKQPVNEWALKDKTDFANRCYTLAQLYVNTNTYDKATFALNAGRPFADDYLIDMRYKLMLMNIFSKTNNIDSALYYLHTYINPIEDKFKDRATIPDFMIVSNLYISNYYIGKKQYEKARPYLEKVNAYPENKIQPFEAYQIQKTTGLYYEQTGDFTKAIALFTKALPVAEQLSKEDYADLLKYLAIAYKGAGNLSLSTQFYNKYIESLDSLTNEKLSRNFADQQTRYETNQKQQQIVALDKENKLKVLQLQNAARTKWLLVIGLSGLSAIALLLFFIYRNREKLNKQLNVQKEELQKLNSQLSVANDTKAKLFGIISHDLRSPVSKVAQLIHLQKKHPGMLSEQDVKKHEENINQSMENVLETMEDLLLWSKSQMQQFKVEKTKVNISDIVARECGFLQYAMAEKNITINNLPGNFFQITDENFITVIIRNLLQNAIKYGNANTEILITSDAVQLKIINASSHADVEVLNDQLNNKQINSNTSGLGLQIVSDLAAQLAVDIFFKQQSNNHIAAVIQFTN